MPYSIFKLVLICLLSALLLTACDSSPPPATDRSSENEENSKELESLMQGGFYGEESPKLVGQKESNSDTSAENEPGTEKLARQSEVAPDSPEAEGSLADAEISSIINHDSINGPTNSPDDNGATNIVADIGFSEQQEVILDESVAPAFCLAKGSKTNPEVTQQTCDKISRRLASVSMQACTAARLKPSGCRSVKDFPILVREFPPLKQRMPQGKILLVGGTHGDELTSVSVAFRWIEKLNKYHSGIFHWRVVPLMNPDGVLKREASRTNQNGVDLNRNMPSDDWENSALSYWENKVGQDPRKYPGKAAASEPETQWLIDEINAFKPDAIISIHAPYGVVDFDALLLNTAPKSLGKLHLNLLGTYPGSLGNYAGINRDIPVITLELPHAWEMPSDNDTTKIWEDIVSWLKTNIDTRGENEAIAADAGD